MSDEQKPLVQNAASVKQTRNAKKREKRFGQLQEERLRAVLSTRQGRRWYWDRMGYCGVFLKHIPHDSQSTAHFLGMRNVGLDMLEELNQLEPEVFLQMSKEAREDRERGF